MARRRSLSRLSSRVRIWRDSAHGSRPDDRRHAELLRSVHQPVRWRRNGDADGSEGSEGQKNFAHYFLL